MAHQLAIIPAPTGKQAVIDEYGELCRRIEAFAPTVKRHKELKDEIRAWYDETPPDETLIARGKEYEIHVGAREWQSEIVSMPALQRAIGAKLFFLHCKFPLTILTKLLPEAALDKLLSKSQGGLRSVKAVPLGSPVESDNKSHRRAGS